MQWSYTAPAIQPENSNTLLIYQVQAASFQKSQPPEKLPKCLQTSLNQEALKREHQIEQKRRKHIFLSTPNRYRNPLDLIRIKGRVLRISPRRLKEGKRKKKSLPSITSIRRTKPIIIHRKPKFNAKDTHRSNLDCRRRTHPQETTREGFTRNHEKLDRGGRSPAWRRARRC